MDDQVKVAVDAMATAFEEFKSVNDARLAEIESKGSADPVTEEKLATIGTTPVFTLTIGREKNNHEILSKIGLCTNQSAAMSTILFFLISLGFPLP